MDLHSETGSVSVGSSLRPHYSKSLQDILTEINQNVQGMLRLIKDSEAESRDKFLCLYQSLGERYNDLNQEMLNGRFTFDSKPSCSDHTYASSMGDLRSLTSSSEMVPSFKLIHDEVEKNQSGYLIADMFCAELETARKEIEFEKGKVFGLESKLSDSSCKIEFLESELDETSMLLEVSEAEVTKLVEMLSECKAGKANLQTDNAAELLDSLREELRARDKQIEQMEEYLNQVCSEDTEIVAEELRARVEELEKEVEVQRGVISEREEEKREAIRQLCVSVDHYKSRYTDLINHFQATKWMGLKSNTWKRSCACTTDAN